MKKRPTRKPPARVTGGPPEQNRQRALQARRVLAAHYRARYRTR